MRRFSLSLPLPLLLLAGLAWGENWPMFRGPTGLGTTKEANLPLTWGGKDGTNVLWTAPLTGQGHASPIVWDDRVFVTTVAWDDSVQDRKKVIPTHHLLCWQASDGKPLWDTVIPPGQWLRDDFRSGPGGGYAAPTPATDGKLVFCAFGSSVIAAVDLDGSIVWRKEIEPHTFDVTLGTSPILYGDTVILLCAMRDKKDSRIVAWKKATGDVAWEVPLPTTGFGHSTPVITRVNGQDQMIVVASAMGRTSDGIQSFDPADGKRLWWCVGAGDAASPVVGAGIVYADNGRGGPGVAVDPTGSGDVAKTHLKWTSRDAVGIVGSPVIVGDLIYRMRSNSVKCVRADTGALVQAINTNAKVSDWASPIADPRGYIYFATAGQTVVVKTGPKPEVVAVNDLGDPNHASAAASKGRLFLVGTKNIHCVGEK